MELLTKELEKKLFKKPLYSTWAPGFDAEVIVEFFNPLGRSRWFITDGKKMPDGDWMIYGLVYITDWEWSCVMLSDLEKNKLPYNMRIEREKFYDGGQTVRETFKLEGGVL